MRSGVTREECVALDRADPLASYRGEFVVEDESLIYLDGNSLGRLPRATVDRVGQVLDAEWGHGLIRSWASTWVEMPTRLGDLIGTGLLGADPGEVVVADNTTVSLYKAVSAALDSCPERSTVVIESANFPTDRYVVESLARQRSLDVRWVPETGPEPLGADDLAPHLDDSVAVVVLSHVDYRSAALLDMPVLTALARGVGALTVWDLCHSVGAVPIDVHAAGVDLAVGCTYKYLNGGPGAPAFTYVSAARQRKLAQPIWGWWGGADMFDMAEGYSPQADIRSWLTGTPGVLSLAAVEPGVEMVVRAGISAIRQKSVALTGLAVELYDAWLAAEGVTLSSPRDPDRRGSHVTLSHRDAKAIAAELADAGVLPDFRRPCGIRLGMSALSTRFVDVYDGLAALRNAVTATRR